MPKITSKSFSIRTQVGHIENLIEKFVKRGQNANDCDDLARIALRGKCEQ